MQTAAEMAPAPRRRRWLGWLVTAFPALFLAADAVGKLLKPGPVVEGTVKLGYPETVLTGLGIVLLASTILYVIPRTSVLGAILLTGYLGGAVATHVRVSDPLFTHVLFPVYLGIVVWVGLCLRDPRVHALFAPGASRDGDARRGTWP